MRMSNKFIIFSLVFFFMNTNHLLLAEPYPIKKVIHKGKRAVIQTSEDDYVERGDTLYLETLLGSCKVRVLKTKTTKALISLRRCNFEVNDKDVVIEHRVYDKEDRPEEGLLGVGEDGYRYDEEIEAKEESGLLLKEIGRPQYVVGGITSLILGLGVGHAIQGRYFEDSAYMHTLAQIVGLAMFMSSRHDLGNTNYWIGLYAFIGSRITEMIGVWRIDDKRYKLEQSYKPNNSLAHSSFSLSPHLTSDRRAGVRLAINWGL